MRMMKNQAMIFKNINMGLYILEIVHIGLEIVHIGIGEIVHIGIGEIVNIGEIVILERL